METFSQTFGFVMAVCGGIIILTVFFMVVGYIKGLSAGPGLVKMKGFLKDAKFVNIYLTSGKTLERVRFVGFTDPASVKGANIPYQLSNMVVLEKADGTRILIRADAVKMIEELKDQDVTANVPAT